MTYLTGDDDAGLLGWADSLSLIGWEPPALIGQFDPSTSPIGGPVGERVCILTATLYPDWTNQSVPVVAGEAPAIGNHPIGGFPFGAALSMPGPVQLRLADTNFVTADTDTLYPSMGFDDRVIDPGSIGFSLPLTPVGSAAIESKYGSVVIDNTDAFFDTLLDQATAVSQALKIRLGRVGYDTSTFVTLFNARITNVGLTETQATLDLQDPVLYAQNAYPTTVYTGAGGANGDADLEGVVKPVVLGRVWNMSPVLINAVGLIYQAHDGAISSVSGVFDGGVPLTFSANYASYTALAAASLTGGQYATCLAAGLIRVGGTPAYALTAHVDGSSLAGNTIPSIVGRLLTQLGTQIDIAINAGSLSILPGWVAGWMWTEPFTLAEAISRFVGDGGCHWGADADGVVRILKLEPPDADAVVASYDMHDMDIERAPMPPGYEGIHQRQQVQYLKNWTVQDASSLAATASAPAGRQREWRTSLSTVSVTSRNAIDPEVLQTSLASATDAASLGATLLTLHGTPRQCFTMDAKLFGVLPKLGDTVAVRYPRFGLAGGLVFRVVAIDISLSDNAQKLLLWGGLPTVDPAGSIVDFSTPAAGQYLPLLIED